MSQSLRLLRTDFTVYARAALKIRTKDGGVKPFRLNSAQRYIHQRIEEQLNQTGKVRALILKGRQMGCSTYVEARFYWKVSGQFGRNAYILTHEQKATDNLFGMAQRYHQHCPAELRPSTKRSNAKELYFDRLDSGYQVATAGSEGTGRSGTAQYFHGSEVAHWPNAESHMAGIGQVVPSGAAAAGTEIILETTANGIGDLFHRMWQAAERGDGEYIAIFVPWFWQEEYRAAVPPGFQLTEDEIEYQDAYGLSIEQMVWRRYKITDEFGGDTGYFDQEYPATADLAFVAVGTDSFIKSKSVAKARRQDRIIERWGPKIIGVDPARFGDDATAIIRRQGRVAYNPERFTKLSTMEVAGRIARIIDDERPDQVFIDIGGLGAGIYDRLVELRYGKIVSPVNFGERAHDERKYANRRAEMWGGMKEWLDTPGGVLIPDSNALHGDLIGPQYAYDSLGRTKLEKKEDMRKRGLSSPDDGDALALTFADPVRIGGQRREEVDSWRERLRALSKKKRRSAMAG